MSDLTPEEQLSREMRDAAIYCEGAAVPWMTARDIALAAVAAERERTLAEVCDWLDSDAALWEPGQLSSAVWGAFDPAREGDTTERKKGNAGEPAKPPPGTIRHRAEGDTTDA